MSSEIGMYDVTYIVFRPVTFRVAAPSLAAAAEIAIEKGDSIEVGPVIDYRHVSTKPVERPGESVSTSTSDISETRLKEAAPDLLVALKELVERSRVEAAARGFRDEQMTWLDTARLAIAKATGQG
ncbi:MAG TPA: hypothetical protein VKX49_09060 [Bryobacteraceae bacterium]|jgi:hypothetical protein|nr:hypothetical protein [Bryobacteraceae bacterium]